MSCRSPRAARALAVALLAGALAVLPASARTAPADGPLRVRPTALLAGTPERPAAVLAIESASPVPPGAVLRLRARGGAPAEAPWDGRPTRRTLPWPPGEGPFDVTVELVAGGQVSSTRVTVPRAPPGRTLHLLPLWRPTGADLRAQAERLSELLHLLRERPEARLSLRDAPALGGRLPPQDLRTLESSLAEGRLRLVVPGAPLATAGLAPETAGRALLGDGHRTGLLGQTADAFVLDDVSLHLPQLPMLLAEAGLTGGIAGRPPDDPLPSTEVLWTAPDGSSVLSHLVGTAARTAAARLVSAEPDALPACWDDLQAHALTSHVLLPVPIASAEELGALLDAAGAFGRTWLSPRVVLDSPGAALAAVRDELAALGRVAPVASLPRRGPARTPDPELLAARERLETALLEAERAATAASLLGASFPSTVIDRGGEQLRALLHPAVVTGGAGAALRLDLLERARRGVTDLARTRDLALAWLARHVDTRRAIDGLLAFDLLGVTRDGRALSPTAGARALAVELPRVPAFGWRVLEQVPPPVRPPADAAADPFVLETSRLRAVLDPGRGALTSLYDKARGEELLAGPAALVEEGGALAVRDPLHVVGAGEARVAVEGDHGLWRPRIELALLDEHRLRWRLTVRDWRGLSRGISAVVPLSLHGSSLLALGGAGPLVRPTSAAGGRGPGDAVLARQVAIASLVTVDVRATGSGEPLARRPLGVASILIGEAAPPPRGEQANALARALLAAGVPATVQVAPPAGALPAGDGTSTWLLLGAPDEHPLLAATLAQSRLQAVPASAFVEAPGEVPRLVLPAEPALLSEVEHTLRTQSRIVVPAFRAVLAGAGRVPPGASLLVDTGGAAARLSGDGVLRLPLLAAARPASPREATPPGAPSHPDGSPLTALHGTHAFDVVFTLPRDEPGLAAASADAWRRRLPLLVRTEAPHDGPLPPAGSLLRVLGEARLVAFKPAGFAESGPLPRRRTGSTRLVARLENDGAAPAAVTLRPTVPLRAAWSTDLREQRGDALTVSNGAVSVTVPARGRASVLLEIDPAPPAPSGGSLDPTAGERLPGDRHDGGSLLGLEAAGQDGRTLRLLNRHRTLSAEVVLAVGERPGPELAVEPSPLRLAPGEESAATLVAEAPFDGPVQVLADAHWREELSGGAGDLQQRVVAILGARSGGQAPVAIEMDAPLVASGGVLAATLSNLTAEPRHGRVAFVAPPVAWNGSQPAERPMTLPPGGRARVAWTLAEVPDTWALLRWEDAAGTVDGPPVALVATRARRLLSFDRAELTLRRAVATPWTATLQSLLPLAADERLVVLPDQGLRLREGERRLFRDPGGVHRLEIDLLLRAPEASSEGVLRVEAGRGVEATAALLPYRVADAVPP